MVPAWSLLLVPAPAGGEPGLGRRLARSSARGPGPWPGSGSCWRPRSALLGSGYVAYRAWGVPDVGPQSDPVAARPEVLPRRPGRRRGVPPSLIRPARTARPGPGTGWRAAPSSRSSSGDGTRNRRRSLAWWRRNRAAIDLARAASTLPGSVRGRRAADGRFGGRTRSISGAPDRWRGSWPWTPASGWPGATWTELGRHPRPVPDGRPATRRARPR